MKISDLLNESQQLDELTAADVGKGVGKVAKGIGAVAGGIAGIPGAVKKGFQAGKQTVSGAADAKTAAPAAVGKAQPAQATAAATAQPQAKPAAAQTTASEPEQEPAAPEVKAAAPAAKEPAAAPVGGDVEAVKQELTSFLQTYKKDLAMQNKNWEFVVPKVNALEKQVADLVAKKAKPADAKKKAPSQAEIDADRERLMGVTNDSVIRKAPAVNESIQLFKK